MPIHRCRVVASNGVGCQSSHHSHQSQPKMDCKDSRPLQSTHGYTFTEISSFRFFDATTISPWPFYPSWIWAIISLTWSGNIGRIRVDEHDLIPGNLKNMGNLHLTDPGWLSCGWMISTKFFSSSLVVTMLRKMRYHLIWSSSNKYYGLCRICSSFRPLTTKYKMILYYRIQPRRLEMGGFWYTFTCFLEWCKSRISISF